MDEKVLPSISQQENQALVSFTLFAYNQEDFIREAIEGAFAQTYQPLEIILSDDCSTDRTFEIMREAASAYSGPHQIILNSNAQNLGIGAHVAKIFDMAKGEIIVAAAGDDISVPERTALIAKAAQANPDAMAFCSDYREIGSNAVIQANPPHSLSSLLARSNWIHGATAAYRSQIHKNFEKMSAKVRNEDEVYALRALAVGGRIHAMNQPLVHYRTGVGVSAFNFQEYNPRVFKRESLQNTKFRNYLIKQWTRDLTQIGKGSSRSEMYLFRLENSYKLALATRKRVWKLFSIYQYRFGLKKATFLFLGYFYPVVLNFYLKFRYGFLVKKYINEKFLK